MKLGNYKFKLATGVATSILAGALISVPAHAQADADENEGARTLDAITVTAQRREENLQDVPVAVTALTAEQLEVRQIRDVNDLQIQIPNAVISTGTGTASSARIFFRGVGEDESRGAIDPAVGIYIDGVYIGRTVGSLVDLVDVEQVEVLRGPQGTLYGRNTNGGAIKLNSVLPEPGEYSLDADFTVGSDDRFAVKASTNIGLGDSTAARISTLYKYRDGFFEITPNGIFEGQDADNVGLEQVFAIRGSLKHEFNEDWSALFTVDYTDDSSDPTPGSIIQESDDPSVVTDADGDQFTIEPVDGLTCTSVFPVGCTTIFNSNVEAFGVSGKIEGNIGPFTVTSLSAFRTLEDDLITQINFPFDQTTDQEQFSQELNLASNFDGPFNFVSGLYFYHEDVTLDTNFAFIPANIEVDTTSFAVFAQGTLDVTEDLTLTGGLRFTTEDRDFFGDSSFLPGVLPVPIEGDLDTNEVTWTAKADYSVTDDILIYASVATGFKTPGFSPDCFSPVFCFAQVEQEDLISYEGGLRTEWFNKTLTFNATYFFNDYEDLQISATLPTGAFTRTNAADARIQGIELETNWSPLEGLNIYGHASWLDAEYRNLTAFQAGTLSNSSLTAPGPSCINVTAVAGTPEFDEQIIDCALDLELKNAPQFKTNVGFTYAYPIFGGDVTLGGDLAWEDESFALVANNAGSLTDPGVRINARVGYAPESGLWRISVWGKNLTDRDFFQATSGTNIVFPSAPLTWGVDLGVSF